MKRSYFIFLLFFILLFSACKKKRDLSKIEYLKPAHDVGADSVFLILSSSVEGYVESCGCTSKPLGDIARFAQVFHDIKAAGKNTPILVSSGNLLFDTESRNAADLCQDNARIELLLSTLSGLGMKYGVVGPLDNSRGEKYRDDWYKKFGIEILDKKHSSALINTTVANILLLSVNNDSDKKLIIEAITQYKKNNSFPLVIALSQMPKEKSREYFQNFAGIDVVVQGQIESTVPRTPERLGINGPIYIEAGRQNQYFSYLIIQNLKKRDSSPLILDERSSKQDGDIELLRSRILSLTSQIDTAPDTRKDFLRQRIDLAAMELKKLMDDREYLKPLAGANIRFESIPLAKNIDTMPSIKEKLEKYKKNISSLVASCEEQLLCPMAVPGEAVFVGAENCKGCHSAAYNFWKNALYTGQGQDESGKIVKRLMGHSKAYETLLQIHKETDRSCIGCHSVGFMKAGGFCKVSEVGNFKDVQCESCHGPGSLHAQNGNKKAIGMPNEETCRGCHHVPHIQSYESFNYIESLKKILGPGHGERLLGEIEHRVRN